MQQRSQAKRTKDTLRYLALLERDPKTFRQVLQDAPDAVIKAICNAALNALQNKDVVITRTQRKHLARFRVAVSVLANKEIALQRKRKLLLSKNQQVGGAFFIPAILGAVLGALGSRFIGSQQ